MCAVITDLPAEGLEIDITVFFNITSTAVNSPGLVTDCKNWLYTDPFYYFLQLQGMIFNLQSLFQW